LLTSIDERFAAAIWAGENVKHEFQVLFWMWMGCTCAHIASATASMINIFLSSMVTSVRWMKPDEFHAVGRWVLQPGTTHY
jgi:hypothetical protein